MQPGTGGPPTAPVVRPGDGVDVDAERGRQTASTRETSTGWQGSGGDGLDEPAAELLESGVSPVRSIVTSVPHLNPMLALL